MLCGTVDAFYGAAFRRAYVYISIALLANRFDVLWVMGQVGHEDFEDDDGRLRAAAAAS
jgi:hypothetical protein